MESRRAGTKQHLCVRAGTAAVLLTVLVVRSALGQGVDEGEVYLRLEYGWQMSKVGNYPHVVADRLERGEPVVTGILADAGGVWGGEASSCCIKRYLSGGTFARAVGSPWLSVSEMPLSGERLPATYRGATWAFLTGLQSFATDTRGFVYALVEPHSRVLVFDAEGSPVLSRRDASGFTYELRGWEKMCYQLRRSMQVLWPEVTAVRCSRHDDVFLTIANAPSDDGTARPRIARFNAELDFVGWRDGQYADLEGCTYEFSTNADGGWLLRRYDDAGALAETLSLPIPDTEKEAPSQVSGKPKQPGVLLDGRHHTYLLFHEPAAVFERKNMATTMQRAVRLHEYDGAGVLLRTLRLPVVAMGVGAPCVTVDPEGTIYYAIYGTLALEVWRIAGSAG